jgi:hypothetical protein
MYGKEIEEKREFTAQQDFVSAKMSVNSMY